jgi:NarL family two-component system response regulator LiaR
MVRTVIIFGVCMAVLLGLLKWAEYMFFARDLALEAYIGIVGLFCTILGGWIGWKLTQKPVPDYAAHELHPLDASPAGCTVLNTFNLSPREHEVLILISEGLSYQQIADCLNVSLSTVKTHASNIFSKMDVQRRTQAVMVAQKNGLIPPSKG